jgi:hypothetical protein
MFPMAIKVSVIGFRFHNVSNAVFVISVMSVSNLLKLIKLCLTIEIVNILHSASITFSSNWMQQSTLNLLKLFASNYQIIVALSEWL